jgi:hypothetical protein
MKAFTDAEDAKGLRGIDFILGDAAAVVRDLKQQLVFAFAPVARSHLSASAWRMMLVKSS